MNTYQLETCTPAFVWRAYGTQNDKRTSETGVPRFSDETLACVLMYNMIWCRSKPYSSLCILCTCVFEKFYVPNLVIQTQSRLFAKLFGIDTNTLRFWHLLGWRSSRLLTSRTHSTQLLIMWCTISIVRSVSTGLRIVHLPSKIPSNSISNKP